VPAQTTSADFKNASELAYKNVIEDRSLDGTAAPGEKEAKLKMHLRTAQAAADGLETFSASKSTPQEELYAKVDDILLSYLDDLYGSKIDATDHSKYFLHEPWT
jgi:cysteinyl-tRNA synthetase